MEWVVNGYTLPRAAFMLLGGQSADRPGRRRVLLVCLALFTFASLLAGMAGDTATLPGPQADGGRPGQRRESPAVATDGTLAARCDAAASQPRRGDDR